jgi:hypothetical protein
MLRRIPRPILISSKPLLQRASWSMRIARESAQRQYAVVASLSRCSAANHLAGKGTRVCRTPGELFSRAALAVVGFSGRDGSMDWLRFHLRCLGRIEQRATPERPSDTQGASASPSQAAPTRPVRPSQHDTDQRPRSNFLEGSDTHGAERTPLMRPSFSGVEHCSNRELANLLRVHRCKRASDK